MPVVEHFLDLERRGIELSLNAAGLRATPAWALSTHDRILLREHHENVCAVLRYIDGEPDAGTGDASKIALPLEPGSAR